jgi:hypothetical protein
MFACPMAKNDAELSITTPLESKSYVRMTKDVLSQHSIKVDISEDFTKLNIPSNQKYLPNDGKVPGDFSSAAFILAAAAAGDGYSAGYTVLTYHTGATPYTASWSAANNVWKNTGAPATAVIGCTIAPLTTFSNFAWVEVTLNTAGITPGPGYLWSLGTLTMYFET